MSKQIVSDQISADDLPKPVGWRILVEPIKVTEKSAGGIVMPESVKDAQEYLRCVAQVIAMGPLCYKHAKFEGGDPWCKVGDWVIIGEHAGQRIKVRNTDNGLTELKVLSDDEIRATVADPTSVMNYV